MSKDGNGYPKPETRRVFTLLGHRHGLIFVPMGLLMGKKLDPAGLRAWVWKHITRTRKPMGFLNPVQPSTFLFYFTNYNVFCVSPLLSTLVNLEYISSGCGCC